MRWDLFCAVTEKGGESFGGSLRNSTCYSFAVVCLISNIKYQTNSQEICRCKHATDIHLLFTTENVSKLAHVFNIMIFQIE